MMEPKTEPDGYEEKQVQDGTASDDPERHTPVAVGENELHRELKGRHMQMIAL